MANFCIHCGKDLKKEIGGCEKCNNVSIEIETNKKKDITTIIIYFGLLFILPIILVSVWASSGGIVNFEIEDIPTWIFLTPIVIGLVLFTIMYWKTLVKDTKRLTKENIKFIGIMTGITLGINMALGLIFYHFDVTVDNQESLIEIFTQAIIFSSFTMAIAAPVVEEIVFRKAFNGLIEDTRIFILVSALVFGLLHWSGIATISYIILGGLWAYTYIKTNRNLMAAIIVHFINNALGVFFLLIDYFL